MIAPRFGAVGSTCNTPIITHAATRLTHSADNQAYATVNAFADKRSANPSKLVDESFARA